MYQRLLFKGAQLNMLNYIQLQSTQSMHWVFAFAFAHQGQNLASHSAVAPTTAYVYMADVYIS